MIKFFRNIRQSSLTENKFSAYFLYATGEIILVVIGILIALYINNWNNQNQQNKLEIKYLNEIKNNLKADLHDLDFNIEFNESKLQSNKVVLQYLTRKIDYSDSLEFHFSNLLFSTRTLINKSAYENLKSRGLEIVSNDSLRRHITTLYEFDFYSVIDFEGKDDHMFQFQILTQEVIKAINLKEFKPTGQIPNGLAAPIDKELLLNNYQFKNALMINISFREYMIYAYQNLKKNTEKCISEIENELKRLE